MLRVSFFYLKLNDLHYDVDHVDICLSAVLKVKVISVKLADFFFKQFFFLLRIFTTIQKKKNKKKNHLKETIRITIS